jgi:hypothetical protein
VYIPHEHVSFTIHAVVHDRGLFLLLQTMLAAIQQARESMGTWTDALYQVSI